MFGRITILIVLLVFAGLNSSAQYILTRATESAQIEIKVDIYPNPATDYLTVELSEVNAGNVEFELRSMIGTTIRISPEKIGYNQYRIPLKEYATGYYFLIVQDERIRFKKAFKFLKR
ncbi:MAG: T9SS type A sorting domain-containing protein [Cyclobacteriaceae bacterium]